MNATKVTTPLDDAIALAQEYGWTLVRAETTSAMEFITGGSRLYVRVELERGSARATGEAYTVAQAVLNALNLVAYVNLARV